MPRDTQLCELANPAKWDNEEWLDILRSLGLSDDKLSMHRKPYEFTQLLFGCRRLGALRDDAPGPQRRRRTRAGPVLAGQSRPAASSRPTCTKASGRTCRAARATRTSSNGRTTTRRFPIGAII